MIKPPSKLLLILLLVLIPNIISIDEIEYNNFISVEAINNPILIKNKTLADMVEYNMDMYSLSYDIIKCESGWKPYAKNKESTAYGLGQFLDGTWKYVQDKWKMELDRNSYDDQLYAMVRLLEEEGWKHWAESKWCWDPYNKY